MDDLVQLVHRSLDREVGGWEPIPSSLPTVGRARGIVGAVVAIAVVATGVVTLDLRHGQGRTRSSISAAAPSGDLSVTVTRGDGGTVTPELMEGLRLVVSERLDRAQLGGSVTVSGSQLLIDPGEPVPDSLRPALLARPELTFRVVESVAVQSCPAGLTVAPSATSAAQACGLIGQGSMIFRLKPAGVTGDDLADVTVDEQQAIGAPTGLSEVDVSFKDDAFARLTESTAMDSPSPPSCSVPQPTTCQIAVDLDGVVLTAPTNQAPIEGNAEIPGTYTPAQASDLAARIRAAMVPVVLTAAG